MRFLELPVELILRIITFLPIPSVLSLRVVCQTLRDTIDLKQNEQWIFHQIAYRNGWIDKLEKGYEEGVTKRYSIKALHGTDGKRWKSFCKRRFKIDNAWRGTPKSRCRLRQYPATGDSVHRIKVDEEEGFMINTNSTGGLFVTSIDYGFSMWSLPNAYVRGYAHCEYSKGYLIFDRTTGEKEVWRLKRHIIDEHIAGSSQAIEMPSGASLSSASFPASMWHLYPFRDSHKWIPEGVVEGSRPDGRQIRELVRIEAELKKLVFGDREAGEENEEQEESEEEPQDQQVQDPLLSTSSTPAANVNTEENSSLPQATVPIAGQFVPWALLRVDEPTVAFRFVYPHLLVSSIDTAFLWDVRTGQLAQKIEGLQSLPARPPWIQADNSAQTTANSQCQSGNGGGGQNSALGFALVSAIAPSMAVVPFTGIGAAGMLPTPRLGRLRYVEFSKRHVFVCGTKVLRVFSRETRRPVMDILGGKKGWWESSWGNAMLNGQEGEKPMRRIVRYDREYSEEDRKEGEKTWYYILGKSDSSERPPPFSGVEGPAASEVVDEGKAEMEGAVDKGKAKEEEAKSVTESFSEEALTEDCWDTADNGNGHPDSEDDNNWNAGGDWDEGDYDMTSGDFRRGYDWREVVGHEVGVRETELKIENGARGSEFIAVHVSECGKHLVALLWGSRLLIVYNFETIFKEGNGLDAALVEVQLGAPNRGAKYLAFENGRIAAATGNGVFIIHPDWSTPPTSTSAPEIQISRVRSLSDASCLLGISCLQMSDTGLYMNWDSERLMNKDRLKEVEKEMNDVWDGMVKHGDNPEKLKVVVTSLSGIELRGNLFSTVHVVDIPRTRLPIDTFEAMQNESFQRPRRSR
ncbi:hypothetical protein AX16_005054 [Volvariella volvacea WC 439]|nr:hypothetical protein AX16_005054 [Volvariella volvacea WC 439]